MGGFVAALGGSQFQPVPGFGQIDMARLAVQTPQFQLRTAVMRTTGLAQQLETDAPVTRIATIAAKQFAQTALRHDYTLARRLFEQAAGELFGTDAMAQARAVQ